MVCVALLLTGVQAYFLTFQHIHPDLGVKLFPYETLPIHQPLTPSDYSKMGH